MSRVGKCRVCQEENNYLRKERVGQKERSRKDVDLREIKSKRDHSIVVLR